MPSRIWRPARIDQEVVLSPRWIPALAAVLAAACCTVSSPAHASTSCGPAGFAYAGLQPNRNGDGISAVLTSLMQPAVESGHVAGWVGGGGPGQGPGGSDEWIQVGLNSLPGTGNTLYYEVMRLGAGVSYGELATNVRNGHPVRVAVLETASQRNFWRVWVDGRPVTPPIKLVGSHRTLTAMAMGESWDGGQPACNRFSYRFEGVSVAAAPGGSWRAANDAAVLQDPGYRVTRRAWPRSTPLPPGRCPPHHGRSRAGQRRRRSCREPTTRPTG